jgi:putative transposase
MAPHTRFPTVPREIIAWSAVANAGIAGEMVRDLMLALGLTLLFTPVRSPESNGMSESFVKTLKRDYARVNILHDADAILAMLPDWIEDYCEVHPHSGLKFRSPREFIRLSA